MSKQVFKQKPSFVSSYKLEKIGYRSSKMFSKKGKVKRGRRLLTLRKLYTWNKRAFWKSAGYNKKKILNRVLKLGYYWYSRLHFKFNLIMLGLKNVIQQNTFLKLSDRVFSISNSLYNSVFFHISPYIYRTIMIKSRQLYIGANHYSLNMQRIRYLSKLVSKFVMWKVYPTWLLRKYFRIFLFRKRRLKKLLLARYIRRMFNFNGSSFYME